MQTSFVLPPPQLRTPTQTHENQTSHACVLYYYYYYNINAIFILYIYTRRRRLWERASTRRASGEVGSESPTFLYNIVDASPPRRENFCGGNCRSLILTHLRYVRALVGREEKEGERERAYIYIYICVQMENRREKGCAVYV